MINMDALLKKYIETWQLSTPTLIAKTNTSHVYKVTYKNNNAVLKIYTQSGRIHESIGPYFLQACHGNGVVDVYKFDDKACLLEFIDGPEVLSLVNEGKDDEATKIIAQILNKIHAAGIPIAHNFQTFEVHFDDLLNHAVDAPKIIHRGSKLLKSRLKNQIEIHLLHGDIHHTNIMHHHKRGWIALDPHPVIGDRAYDYANTLHNPLKRPELTEDKNRILQQVKTLSDKTDIDPQRIIDYGFIHGCIASCWTKINKGHYQESWLRTSEILEPHISKI